MKLNMQIGLRPKQYLVEITQDFSYKHNMSSHYWKVKCKFGVIQDIPVISLLLKNDYFLSAQGIKVTELEK